MINPLITEQVNYTLSFDIEEKKLFKLGTKIDMSSACRALVDPLTTGTHTLAIAVEKGSTEQLLAQPECVYNNNVHETTIEVDCSDGKYIVTACVLSIIRNSKYDL